MEQLVIYDIHLSDGRKDEIWVEQENDDPYARLEMTPSLLKKIIEQEVEPYFNCKVIKYKWMIEDDEEDEEED